MVDAPVYVQKIEFSPRQFDVLAALMQLKKPQAVATLLGISNKGVEAHLYNIKQKLPLKRKDLRHFIDTCTESEKTTLYAKYQHLLKEQALSEVLKQLKALKKPLAYSWTTDNDVPLQANNHLERAGLIHGDPQGGKQLLIDPSPFLSLDYYQTMGEILKDAFPEAEDLLKDFLEQVSSQKDPLPPSVFKKFGMLSFIGLLLLSVLFFVFYTRPSSIPSDLKTPSFLLARQDMIHQIQRHLKSQSMVALIGIEGSGKTTLARQYAKTWKAQENSFVFELNAESKETLIHSFFDLAYALAKTKDLKDEVALIEHHHKEKQLLLFIKNHLKQYPTPLLIFDNLEDPSLLRDYACTWGKVIVTSRNLNLKNSHYMNTSDILLLNPLTKPEMLELFQKLLNNKPNPQELEKILEQIPPFPLDVTLAAAYINSTSISEYVKNMTNPTTFEPFLEVLVKEGGSYSKTRYSIFKPLVKKLLKDHPDFLEPLLLIGLMESQNIPKDFASPLLIKSLQQYALILTHEKTFSMHRTTQSMILHCLMQEDPLFKKRIPSLIKKLTHSIDSLLELEDLPALQNMIPHLNKLLTLKDLLNQEILYTLRSKLGNIYYYAQTGIYHYAQKILQQNIDAPSSNTEDVLSDFIYMGRIHVQLDEKESLTALLKHITKTYKKELERETLHTAWALSFMGDMYTILGKYVHAKDLLETSCHIYRKKNDAMGLARSLAYLGNVYLKLGNYQKAKGVLDSSYGIYVSAYPSDHYRLGWILQLLGRAHLCLHNYDEARRLMEKSLAIYNLYFAESKILVAWAALYLCNTYIEQGLYQKALTLLEKRREISHRHYHPHHHVCALESFLLGKVLLKTGNLKKAKPLLQDSLKTLKEILPEDHVDIALVETSLGEVLTLQKDYPQAEQYFLKALEILKSKRKPEIHRPLEGLYHLYWQQYLNATKARLDKQARYLHDKSLSILAKITKHFKEYFPNDPPLELKKNPEADFWKSVYEASQLKQEGMSSIEESERSLA